MLLNTNPRIFINKDAGCYVFMNESGAGKTYLYNIIEKISPVVKDVLAFTYGDKIEDCSPGPKRLIVLDRVDMYVTNSDVIDYFMAQSDNAVVLMDLKNTDFLKRPCGFATLYLNKNSLEVYCDPLV